VVRTRAEPSALARSIVDVIHGIDSEQPIENVRTLEEIRAQTLGPQRLNASLISMFALLSLAIAAVGVFGVLGFSVGQRTKEFGIRSTLGADARALLRMVLGEGMRLQSAALLVGLGAALLLAGFLRGFLYGIDPFDPASLLLVAVVLSVVALAASWLPAWRAARVAPIEVLRVD
jgi:putative ABC transport system permease protein